MLLISRFMLSSQVMHMKVFFPDRSQCSCRWAP
uniref:Uncharacterized protein n=1 Tax=Anguilla anguilla TaxID=7936 RepID=A0A0E9UZJ7_ANGAN